MTLGKGQGALWGSQAIGVPQERTRESPTNPVLGGCVWGGSPSKDMGITREGPQHRLGGMGVPCTARGLTSCCGAGNGDRVGGALLHPSSSITDLRPGGLDRGGGPPWWGSRDWAQPSPGHQGCTSHCEGMSRPWGWGGASEGGGGGGRSSLHPHTWLQYFFFFLITKIISSKADPPMAHDTRGSFQIKAGLPFPAAHQGWENDPTPRPPKKGKGALSPAVITPHRGGLLEASLRNNRNCRIPRSSNRFHLLTLLALFLLPPLGSDALPSWKTYKLFFFLPQLPSGNLRFSTFLHKHRHLSFHLAGPSWGGSPSGWGVFSVTAPLLLQQLI